MKIELTKAMFVNGEEGVQGDQFDVSDIDGNYCINRGYAVKVEESDEPQDDDQKKETAKPKAKAAK